MMLPGREVNRQRDRRRAACPTARPGGQNVAPMSLVEQLGALIEQPWQPVFPARQLVPGYRQRKQAAAYPKLMGDGE